MELLVFNMTNGSSPVLQYLLSSESTRFCEQWEISSLFSQDLSMSVNVQSAFTKHLNVAHKRAAQNVTGTQESVSSDLMRQ